MSSSNEACCVRQLTQAINDLTRTITTDAHGIRERGATLDCVSDKPQNLERSETPFRWSYGTGTPMHGGQ